MEDDMKLDDTKLDREGESWESIRLRPDTRDMLKQLAMGEYNEKIRYILLFGSEARGEARLTSDIDISIVSDTPLTRKERRDFLLACGDVYDRVDCRIINTLTSDLGTDRFMDVSYHLKREGIVVYER